jgi:hypothetical protein
MLLLLFKIFSPLRVLHMNWEKKIDKLNYFYPYFSDKDLFNECFSFVRIQMIKHH